MSFKSLGTSTNGVLPLDDFRSTVPFGSDEWSTGRKSYGGVLEPLIVSALVDPATVSFTVIVTFSQPQGVSSVYILNNLERRKDKLKTQLVWIGAQKEPLITARTWRWVDGE